MKGKLLNALGLLVGIAVGVGLLYVLISTSREPKRRRPPDLRPLAEVITVSEQKYKAIIEGFGTIRPSGTLKVVSEVGGMIIEQVTVAFTLNPYLSNLRVDGCYLCLQLLNLSNNR